MASKRATFCTSLAVAAALTTSALAMASAPAGAPLPLDATGTEPFWTIQIRSDGLTLATPDKSETKFTGVETKTDGDRTTWNAKSADGRTITVTVWPQACNDGMSDREFAYTATASTTADVEAANRELKGCAGAPQAGTP